MAYKCWLGAFICVVWETRASMIRGHNDEMERGETHLNLGNLDTRIKKLYETQMDNILIVN
jgi:porphobilinogen deaminase